LSKLALLMSFGPYIFGLATTFAGYYVGKWTLRNQVAARKEEAEVHEEQAPLDALLKVVERRDAEIKELRTQAFDLIGRRLDQDRQREDALIKTMVEQGLGIRTLIEQMAAHREEEARRSAAMHEQFHETQLLVLGAKTTAKVNGTKT
jgi:hypothetical protein